jgi:hypothetical protein
LAAVRRKKPNPQKLASQAGRALQRLKAHKYFHYWGSSIAPVAKDGLVALRHFLDVRPGLE